MLLGKLINWTNLEITRSKFDFNVSIFSENRIGLLNSDETDRYC